MALSKPARERIHAHKDATSVNRWLEEAHTFTPIDDLSGLCGPTRGWR
jgi:hypothetical protein